MATQATRMRRSERRTGRVVALTERDRSALALIGLCRYVSTEQLARTLFTSSDRCRRRCRALFDAGYVSVTLPSSTQPSLFSLTRSGIAAVAEHDQPLAERLHLAGPIRETSIAHHIGVVDCRLFVAAVAPLVGAGLLSWSGPQGALTKVRGLPAFHLEPDGLAHLCVRSDGSDRFVAVEFDAASESLSVLARKLANHRAAVDAGATDGVLLGAVGGERRLGALRELARDTGLVERALILDVETVRRRPVVAPPGLADFVGSLNTGMAVEQEEESERGVSTPEGADGG